ncbi:MAG: hypothetical protein WBK46_04700 [Ruminococcus flavefaciens]
MTDKQLRKLKRAELIEILYYLKRENEELHEENEKLRSKLGAFADEAIEMKKESLSAEKTAEDAGKTE